MSSMYRYSIQHIVIEALLKVFPSIVYEDVLPLPDSWATNQDYALVVSEASDSVTAVSCGNEAANSLIDITAYERLECSDVGAIQAWLRVVAGIVKKLEGYENKIIRVASVSVQGNRNLPYISDKLRARVLTLSIDYEV